MGILKMMNIHAQSGRNKLLGVYIYWFVDDVISQYNEIQNIPGDDARGIFPKININNKN